MQNGIKLKSFDLIKNDQYRIVRYLTDGGEGYIYLAQDVYKNNKICVIKQMFQHPSELAGIEEDYQLFAGLFHPNIVQVMDFFWENGVFYIVMNYIAGNTLAKLLKTKNEPLGELQILEWLNKLAHILDFLHMRPMPIIHADISPDNIMATPQNDLILIDFGIARATFEAIGMREHYSAPEQLSGTLSPATDVFSLGATAFKCLTLKELPSPGFDPREYNPKLSKQVSKLIQKATAPTTTSLFGLIKGRFGDMQEFIYEIHECYAVK